MNVCFFINSQMLNAKFDDLGKIDIFAKRQTTGMQLQCEEQNQICQLICTMLSLCTMLSKIRVVLCWNSLNIAATKNTLKMRKCNKKCWGNPKTCMQMQKRKKNQNVEQS